MEKQTVCLSHMLLSERLKKKTLTRSLKIPTNRMETTTNSLLPFRGLRLASKLQYGMEYIYGCGPATQYEFWVPRKRKYPQERQAISQRPKKLKSRFYYRRSKKGGQVCSTRSTTIPRGLLRLVTWRDPSRPSTDHPSTTDKREAADSPTEHTHTTSERECCCRTSRQCKTAARFHALPAVDGVRKIREPTKLDSDSFIIAVDNCCITSVTNDLKDFIEPPKDRKTAVSGMGGTILATARGMVRWKIEDDDGKVHSIALQKVLYAPDAPF
eukprot:scaffold20822_cov52-Attheya_sp.AAC.8